MSIETADEHDHVDTREDRPSGVPEPGHMGAARNELMWGALAVFIIVAIVAAFIWEATP